MRITARVRGLATAVAGLWLGACATLAAPAYDPLLAEKTSGALANLAKISAQADLGAYEAPASYAGAEPTYVEVVGDLALARVRAQGADASTRLSQAARERLATVVGACADQVVDLAAQHKAAGLKPHSPFVSRALADCDLAAVAAKARS